MARARVQTDFNPPDGQALDPCDPGVLNSVGFTNTRKPYLRFDISAVGADLVSAATLELTYTGTAR
jgi:hypothetical protein